MPGQGGYAVAEYARQHRPGLAVVLTTGYPDRPSAAPDRPEELPLLWKPYTATGLLRALDTALGQAAGYTTDRPSAQDESEGPPGAEAPGSARCLPPPNALAPAWLSHR